MENPMMGRPLLGRLLVLSALSPLLLLLSTLPGAADYVFMNDGQTLRGRVLREGDIIRDPTGGSIWSPRVGGFYLVDDNVRRIVFSQRNVVEARKEPPELIETLDSFRLRPILRLLPVSPVPNYIRMESVGPWKPIGERVVEVLGLPTNEGQSTRAVEQCIMDLNPRWFRVGARGVRWQAMYLTTELDPKTGVEILRHHLDKSLGADKDLDVRLAIIRFCVQATWYDEAEAQLAEFLKHHSKERHKIEELRKDLQKLVANERLKELELAFKTGAHVRAEQIIAEFPETGAPDGVLNTVHSYRLRYKERHASLQQIRRLLETVRKELKHNPPQEFDQALAEIKRDLNFDTLARLDAFQSLALQEERIRAQGKTADLSPEKLLALAVSGWVLGHSGAEAQVGSAVRCWRTRQFILKYLATADARERDGLAGEYSRGEALPVDVITLLIDLLPPAKQDVSISREPFELTTERDAKGTAYHIVLPPEYHHHRSYPVLVALPNVREDAKTVLERWMKLTREHGYILAIPRWADPLATEYKYTIEEQQAVHDTIRDLKRRFHVDAERVFLTGHDWSGNLAYDLGMCAPDLFAGVVVMCGRPGKFHSTHRNNAQYLPFYAIEGEYGTDGPRDNRANRQAFEYWVQRGFPSIYVEYTGRGSEFFTGELPSIFDWMSRKRRSDGLPELGKPTPIGAAFGQEFVCSRGNSARFYWLSTSEVTSPARVTARIADSNLIIAQCAANFRQLTVWLHAGMVDFEQPVDIRINPGVGLRNFKKRVEPSLKVLLDDFYDRRDKKQLFVARVDFNLGR
jgi:tetratricopeptide (TPR) repeat protein